MIIIEPCHNASLFCFIKKSGKVTIEKIREEFPINKEVVNLNNLINIDLQQLIDMGKIKFEDGYYSVIKL